MDDKSRALWELARRVNYHGGDVARALADLGDEDQDRIEEISTAVLTSPTGSERSS